MAVGDDLAAETNKENFDAGQNALD